MERINRQPSQGRAIIARLSSDEPEWEQEHLVSWIFGVFAVLALALAAVGLYSVVSYTVVRIIFASTLGSGILAGLALRAALNTILQKWAGGHSRDPVILPAGTLLLSIVSGIACAIPAWLASRVDPMTALRCD